MLEDLLREGAGTFIGRWYVTLFGVVFVWCAVRDLGWRRTALYTLIALTVGGLAENGSVHLGVPYTRYAFNSDLRGDELFLGDVPLMVPLSYTFMAYFAFSSGRLLASGPWRTRACSGVSSARGRFSTPSSARLTRRRAAIPTACRRAPSR